MSVEKLNDTNFRKEVEEAERAVIKYYADWCGSCRLFAPKFKRLSDDARFSGIKFLEVNAEESPEARRWAGVTSLPFFAVTKKGEIVAATTTAKEEKLLEMLEKLS